MVEQELFVFVVEPEVSGTNNASERQLRSAALDRRTGRTSKTPSGVKRQSVLSSVFQSIGKQLKQFNLAGVTDEVKRWTAVGQSCFEGQLNALPDQKNKTRSTKRVLDQLSLNADQCERMRARARIRAPLPCPQLGQRLIVTAILSDEDQLAQYFHRRNRSHCDGTIAKSGQLQKR